jgi:two-component system, NtrC family, sensor kinase
MNRLHARPAETLPFGAEHYCEWRRRQIMRMAVTYLAPLIILIVYFQYRYAGLEEKSHRAHLGAIAEHQANTLDLFLSERRVNLANLIDHPRFLNPPSSGNMNEHLDDLRRVSDAFVDLGFFDGSGVQVAYAGPHPSLESRDYRAEDWYVTLQKTPDNFIITDIYLGFRKQLHFTIAVSRRINDQFLVLRATLDPARMYEYMESQQASGDVATCLVNANGIYQLVDSGVGQPLDACPISVPRQTAFGEGNATVADTARHYAFRWLRNANWCLIIQSRASGGLPRYFQPRSSIVSAILLILAIVVILNRSSKLVAQQKETDETRAQLEHAAKLASVGELASGIAHEINNPLAVITEESGLLMDYSDPQFGKTLEKEDLCRRLETIQKSAFRCRDITRKLLRFVRKTDFDLREHDVHAIIDGVVDDLLGPEISVSNIGIARSYDPSLPAITTDVNQLQQVILNIINNARDAIGNENGTISITTSRDEKRLRLAITDSGCGMPPEQVDRVFMPFFTTKEVGKGTGLGLSVSYGIIHGLGGEIDVESVRGEGTTFTLVLPFKPKR